MMVRIKALVAGAIYSADCMHFRFAPDHLRGCRNGGLRRYTR